MWSSQARDQIQAAVVTYAAAVTTLDPQPTVPGQGLNLHPCAPETLPILFHHSRNFQAVSFMLLLSVIWPFIPLLRLKCWNFLALFLSLFISKFKQIDLRLLPSEYILSLNHFIPSPLGLP